MDFGTMLDGSNQCRKWKYYTSVSSNQFYDNCTDRPQKDITTTRSKVHHTCCTILSKINYKLFRSMTIKPFSSYIRFRDWNQIHQMSQIYWTQRQRFPMYNVSLVSPPPKFNSVSLYDLPFLQVILRQKYSEVLF